MKARIETRIEIPCDVRDRIEEIKKNYFHYEAPVTAAYFPENDKTVFIQVYYDRAIHLGGDTE